MSVLCRTLSVAAGFAVLLSACSSAPPTASAPASGSSNPPALAASAAPAAPSPAGGAPATTASPAAPSASFAGKTITFVVNFSPGGPTDVFGRLLSQWFGRHVPGNPTIVVTNKAGAGGALGAADVYSNAKPDGMTIGVFTSPFAQQVLTPDVGRYDTAKFGWLGGVDETTVAYVDKSLGVSSAADLLKAQGIVVGGLSPDSTKDIEERTFLDALGVKYQYVTGYPGNADVRVAMQRGEVNFFSESLPGWLFDLAPEVKAGNLKPVGQRGLIRDGKTIRDPRVPDVPLYTESIDQLNPGLDKSSITYRAIGANAELSSLLRSIVLPPGASDSVLQTLRKAVADTFADTEFQQAAQKQLHYDMVFVPGDAAQVQAATIIQDAEKASDVVDHLRDLAKQGR